MSHRNRYRLRLLYARHFAATDTTARSDDAGDTIAMDQARDVAILDLTPTAIQSEPVPDPVKAAPIMIVLPPPPPPPPPEQDTAPALLDLSPRTLRAIGDAHDELLNELKKQDAPPPSGAVDLAAFPSPDLLPDPVPIRRKATLASTSPRARRAQALAASAAAGPPKPIAPPPPFSASRWFWDTPGGGGWIIRLSTGHEYGDFGLKRRIETERDPDRRALLKQRLAEHPGTRKASFIEKWAYRSIDTAA